MQSPPGPPSQPPGPAAAPGVPARISLEQAEAQAIGAARRRHRDRKDAECSLQSGRLTSVAGVLIYECTVNVRWMTKPAVLSAWTGREKLPAEYAETAVRVQVDAYSGDVVGISD
jgi:hypothetical protein